MLSKGSEPIDDSSMGTLLWVVFDIVIASLYTTRRGVLASSGVVLRS